MANETSFWYSGAGVLDFTMSIVINVIGCTDIVKGATLLFTRGACRTGNI